MSGRQEEGLSLPCHCSVQGPPRRPRPDYQRRTKGTGCLSPSTLVARLEWLVLRRSNPIDNLPRVEHGAPVFLAVLCYGERNDDSAVVHLLEFPRPLFGDVGTDAYLYLVPGPPLGYVFLRQALLRSRSIRSAIVPTIVIFSLFVLHPQVVMPL